MSEVPKVVRVVAIADALPEWPRRAPSEVFAQMPPAGFGGFTHEGLAALAVVLRRAVERNRKAVGP